MGQLFLELLLVASVALVPWLVSGIAPREYRNRDLDLPRRFLFMLRFPHYAAIILVVLYIATNHPSGTSAIGIDPSLAKNLFRVHPAGLSVVVAALAVALTALSSVSYGVIVGISGLYHKIVRKSEPTWNDLEWDPFGLRNYLTVGGRLLACFDLILGVLAEECVLRGFLVLYLGRTTGLYVPWIVVSILVDVSLHLYQGRAWIPYHLILGSALAWMVTWDVANPLFLPIGVHVFGNMMFTFKAWRQKDRQVKDQRREPVNEVVETASRHESKLSEARRWSGSRLGWLVLYVCCAVACVPVLYGFFERKSSLEVGTQELVDVLKGLQVPSDYASASVQKVQDEYGDLVFAWPTWEDSSYSQSWEGKTGQSVSYHLAWFTKTIFPAYLRIKKSFKKDVPVEVHLSISNALLPFLLYGLAMIGVVMALFKLQPRQVS